MKITVHDGNVDRALRKLSKKLADFGLLTEVRERQAYVKPSVTKKLKHKAAQKRWTKHLVKQTLPKKTF